MLRRAAALGLLLPLAACGVGGGAGDSRELTVLAAASLTDVYEVLAPGFEREHGVRVTLSFGSSTDLAQQAADGAPGDVLATADETSVQVARDAGVTDGVVRFAANALVIATPAGNPADIGSLADLGGATWVRCADEVPCGRVARAVLEDNGITADAASLEDDVRATLDKVVAGEADAGLVYATDAVAAGDEVEAVEIPGAGPEATSYFAATLKRADAPELAQEWVDLLTSSKGRQLLADAGFNVR